MQSIAPAELGGRKANLVTDLQLAAFKVKKLEMFRPTHCSLCILCSQEREKEIVIPLFFFSLQQYP